MNNCIDKDELIIAASALDSIGYLLQEVQENYFSLDNTIQKDVMYILYEFPRYRAYIHAIQELYLVIEKSFKENNINFCDNQYKSFISEENATFSALSQLQKEGG